VESGKLKRGTGKSKRYQKGRGELTFDEKWGQQWGWVKNQKGGKEPMKRGGVKKNHGKELLAPTKTKCGPGPLCRKGRVLRRQTKQTEKGKKSDRNTGGGNKRLKRIMGKSARTGRTNGGGGRREGGGKRKRRRKRVRGKKKGRGGRKTPRARRKISTRKVRGGGGGNGEEKWEKRKRSRCVHNQGKNNDVASGRGAERGKGGGGGEGEEGEGKGGEGEGERESEGFRSGQGARVEIKWGGVRVK